VKFGGVPSIAPPLVFSPAMALSLLATKPITQNARVNNFCIGTDEAPRIQVDVDEQIERAYRQIFSTRARWIAS
jgi:hypothetical protein